MSLTPGLRGAMLVLVAAASAAAPAQEYPAKVVRVIVPWPAGGSSDTLARILGRQLSIWWGHQLVVDNRPGAGTTIGNDLVAKASADGYTLMVTATALVASSALYSNLPYKVERDFAPISLVATAPSVLVVHPSLPVSSVRNLVTLARAHPRQINYASGGNGSSDHIAAELFKMLAKVDMTHVPYKGATPALAELIAGNVQVMFSIAITAVPHMRSGRLRALGITSAKRSALFPDLPTIAEEGIAGYQFETWLGVLAPAGTPAAIVSKVNSDIRKALDVGDIRQKLQSMGAESAGSTPAEFRDRIHSDLVTIANVVKVAGIKVD